MSDLHSAADSSFPHDAVVRMRQLQQLHATVIESDSDHAGVTALQSAELVAVE